MFRHTILCKIKLAQSKVYTSTYSKYKNTFRFTQIVNKPSEKYRRGWRRGGLDEEIEGENEKLK